MAEQQRILLENQAAVGAQPANQGQAVNAPHAVDEYFAGEEGTIAVFDFDYDKIVDFNTKWSWSCCVFNPLCWIPGALCGAPCFLKKNVEWFARSQHVALTVDGIRYVKEKRKSCWGCYCCDKGKESKTVPYDKITDCDVREPAGTACCCCVPRVLSAVHVDTASSGPNKDGVMKHELDLHGLRFASEFKQAVWTMKRGEAPAHATVPLQTGMYPAPRQESMNTQLLTEIRDELQKLNAQVASSGSSSYPKLG
eukprot:gnl/MRDRNA2_/MRDRNA2_91832_c0_seq1.p1 gnl/MRDRNA2_/MRDRNA2_91832_c0~~gnl/MRDRNA2_/MRDRNA2_91832_c0_seq1.p1  ORF type:complete len:253 (-),score=50.45 gnl/MRDRNA2_/MRDRNA2_91832_c0_seq1:99-857(-)